MNEKIFNSDFILSFRRPEVSLRYFQTRKAKLLNQYRVFSATSLMLSVICSCLVTNFPTSKSFEKASHPSILILAWSISFCIFVTNILNFLTKKLSILRWLNYLEFLLLPIICTYIRIVLEILITNNLPFSNFLILVEVLARWYITRSSIFTFVEALFLTGGSMIVIWSCLYVITSSSQMDNAIYYYLVYCFMLLILLLICYYVERITKESFGMKYIQGNKLRCLTDAFEKVETGFLLIRAGKISFINLFLKENLHKFLKASSPVQDALDSENIPLKSKSHITSNQRKTLDIGNKNYEEASPEIMLRSLILGLDLHNINDDSVKKIMQSLLEELNFSNFNVIETIVKYVNQIEKINDFVLIGTKIILQDDSEVYYEIYLKYTYTMTNGNQFTFLFNDVTRTKLKEKQTSEYKYKTLFLSKVAHEFKNPIICITELCKQMSDNSVSEKEKRLILKQVQSMSNYLLILVKDLNIFSESQIGKDFIIEKKETNVDQLLDFCKEITESLILKANKKNSVELKIEKFLNFKSILSDEWRIKQVLLNLLSNAVKFTLFGEVKLVVSYGLKNETNMINFKVVDSGAGMDENFQKNLFKPFEKGTSTGNEQGSGLGLSIVRDICYKMGGTLTCESKQGIGSTFIVEIPVGLIDASDDSNRNSKTVELVADNSKGEISLDVVSGNTIKVDFIPGLFKQTFPVVMSYQCFLSSSPIRMESSFSVNSPREEIIQVAPTIVSFNKISLEDLTPSSNKILSAKKNSSLNVRNLDIIVNIVICDDEVIIRQSLLRIFQKIAEERNLRINVFEAEDGLECLYTIYKCMSLGIKIDMVFSDENMNFLNGSRTSELVRELSDKKKFSKIKFFLVSAFEENYGYNFNTSTITKIINKPLEKQMALKLITDHIDCKNI